MLKLQERSKPSTGIWLVKANTTVGSSQTCDFISTSKKVADVHIELLANHEQITLNDRSNGKSIFVNDIPLGHYGPLKHGDIIRLADMELEIIDPKEELETTNVTPPLINDRTSAQKTWQLVAVGDWLSGQSFEINEKAILGRDSDCDITIPGTHLSRRHAELFIHDGQLQIRDLGSSNGSYVNGKKIDTIGLKPGDEIRFDVLTFEVQGPEPETDNNKTMIRSAISAADTVIDKKDTANTRVEKQWKTKPTSPGNRPEEVLKLQRRRKQKEQNDKWVLYLLITLLAGVIGLFIYAY